MSPSVRKPRITSSIPAAAHERPLHQWSAGSVQYRTVECWHNDQLVGRRVYTRAGQLVIETPLLEGQKHGREYTWDEAGWLALVEPYAHGRIHGTARQYDPMVRVIGTYRCLHGTGYDVWRILDRNGWARVSEIRGLREGERHGFEWWVNDDQRSVWHETHFWAGRHHGIERCWHSAGRLRRGYPIYWIDGQRVTRRQYLRAAMHDTTLPPWRARDNSPQRKLPLAALKRPSGGPMQG
jgi:hypothetical protein